MKHYRSAGNSRLGIILMSLMPVAAGNVVFAESYQITYENTDSADIVLLQATSDFRVIPDIDNDGRADALSLADGPTGLPTSCQSLIIHRSSTLSDGMILSDDVSSQLLIHNTAYFPDDTGCGSVGHLEVIGDVNGDGRSDLALSVSDLPASTSYPYDNTELTAVIFTPNVSAAIDISTLDGTNGFIVDNVSRIVDAGDVNGDGYDDMVMNRVNPIVVSGRDSFNRRYDVSFVPEELTLITRNLHGRGLQAIGDVNGDGRDDILVGHINRINQYAIVYGETELSVILSSPEDLDGQFLLQGCAVSFVCDILPAGDFDGDGYDDLAVSHFGCGYADEAAIIYGGPDGIPRRRAISDYTGTELTRISNNLSGGCLSGRLRGTPGDLDGDASHDLFITLGYRSFEVNNLPNAALIFGTDGRRPDFISIDELDGTNGFQLTLALYSDGAQLAKGKKGLDVDGDGFDDLLNEIFDDFNPIDHNLHGGPRAVVRGKDRAPDADGPRHLVVEQLPDAWHVRWSPPSAGHPVQYRLLLNGSTFDTVDASVQDIMLPGSEAGPLVVQVQALSAAGTVLGSTLRQVPERTTGENLTATVYGPTLVELVFNRQGPWTLSTVTYQLWRNGEMLAIPQDNAGGYWDTTAEPGHTYTYYLTPLYSQFNDVGSLDALRERPVLQRRSNSVTIQTPGGGDDSDDDSDDGGDDEDNETVGDGPTRPGDFRYLIYSDTAAELFWDRSTDDGSVAGYDITRNGALVETRDATSYFDDSLSPGVAYTYAITAVDNNGNRSTTQAVSFTTGEDSGSSDNPSAPSGFRFTVYSDMTAELFWNRSADDGWVAGYEITRDGVIVETRDGLSLFEEMLKPGVEYVYAITAIDNEGNRSAPTSVSLSTDGPVQPTPPAGLTATAYSATAVEIFWDRPVSGPALNYEVRRNGVVQTQTDGVSYFTDALTAGTNYHFDIATIDPDGRRSTPESVAITTFSSGGNQEPMNDR